MGKGRGVGEQEKKKKREREETVLQSPAFTVTASKVTVNGLSTTCRTKLFFVPDAQPGS